MVIFLVVLTIVMVSIKVAIGVTRGRSSRRRRDTEAATMRDVAQQHGWTYVGDEKGWPSVVSSTPPAVTLTYRRDSTVRDVVRGTVDGVAVTWFHLEAHHAVYGWGPGAQMIKGSTCHTYCAVVVPAGLAPLVVCSPGHWAIRGVQPPDVPRRIATGDPWFDPSAVVTSTQPAEALGLLTPPLRDYVTFSGVPFAVAAPWLVTWQDGTIVDSHQLVAQARALLPIASLLPH